MISVNQELDGLGGTPSTPSVQLRIELEGITPTIWRRLVVPVNANFGWLHAVLQIAMGWTNSHLHQFRQDDLVVSDPTFNLDRYDDAPPVIDERKIHLDRLLPPPAPPWIYEYDFGDSWNHSITVEQLTHPSLARPQLAVCVEGSRACPPEDCGSLPGYEDCLAALRNPKHPEHKSMKTWVGPHFDPEAFSVSHVNTCLAMLKWPEVSVTALAKVLTARDKRPRKK